MAATGPIRRVGLQRSAASDGRFAAGAAAARPPASPKHRPNIAKRPPPGRSGARAKARTKLPLQPRQRRRRHGRIKRGRHAGGNGKREQRGRRSSASAARSLPRAPARRTPACSSVRKSQKAARTRGPGARPRPARPTDFSAVSTMPTAAMKDTTRRPRQRRKTPPHGGDHYVVDVVTQPRHRRLCEDCLADAAHEGRQLHSGCARPGARPRTGRTGAHRPRQPGAPSRTVDVIVGLCSLRFCRPC